MPWIQAIVDITADQSAEIEDLLMAIGAQAVTMRDGANQPIYEPPLGTTPLWDNVNLWALFDAEQAVDVQMQQLTAIYEAEYEKPFPNYKLELVEDKDWIREWMDTFKPMPFGKRLWICPSWLEPTDPSAVNLKLDPGLAFGTGTHPTTSLCLKWLDGQDVSAKTVVDFGCGSGILGIAALLLGASNMIGIDIDPQAVEATQANAERNGIEASRYEVKLPPYEGDIKADIVVANILAGPLAELAPVITALVKPNGQLALSGILANQAHNVIDAYREAFHIDSVTEKEEWVRIVATKR